MRRNKDINCKHCERKFKKSDDIIHSTASGIGEYIHEDCHAEWLFRWDFYDLMSYEEMMEELKEEWSDEDL